MEKSLVHIEPGKCAICEQPLSGPFCSNSRCGASPKGPARKKR